MPKSPAEIPQRPTPTGLLPEIEIVLQPGQHYRVRRPVERAEFANHHADALGFKFFPRVNHPLAQHFLVP